MLGKKNAVRLRRLLDVMIPILITQTAIMAMNFCDSAMSGHAGAVHLAGTAIGGNLWMPVMASLNGILLGSMPIIAHLLGRGERQNIGRVVRHTMLLATAFSLLLLVAGVPQEDPAVITAAADFVLYTDEPKQGDTIMETCAKWGVDVFVHYSFPRHLAYETMSRRVAVMKAACEEFGMKFVLETAPDPTSDVGVSGAQAYILEQVPAWVEKYGQKAAYFCTNDAHTEPLLKRLLECGGYFIEADLPSPLMGYPGALGIDLTEEAGDFEKILTKVESAIVEKGGADHFGTWAYSYGYTLSAGLALHAKNVLDCKSELKDMDDVAAALQVYSPKAAWNGASYTNATTGAKSENVFLIYQDTYIMGDPGHFMGNADVEIPEKYFTVS